MMIARKKLFALLVTMAVSTTMLAVACDDTSNAVKEPAPGKEGGPTLPGQEGGPGPGQDGGPGVDGGPTDCVQTPHTPPTHDDIINACTNAVRITKNPPLPLLYPDGGLPPLP